MKLVNLSLTASLMILAVILLRLVFRRAPKWLFCAMWGLVALRLLLPASIESRVSMIPSAEPLPRELLYAETPRIESGIPAVDAAVNPALSRSVTPDAGTNDNPVRPRFFVLSRIWIGGAALMLAYALLSSIVLRRKLRTATLYRKGIRQSELVDSPFVLGIFRPVIYLPYRLDGDDLPLILAHERAHIRRKDHWWKPLGFLLLSAYWFDPILWLAYILFCRDIEGACDEKVVRGLDREELRAYSEALLRCSVRRGGIAVCPPAFGETSVKERVKHVMSYKKPAFRIILAAAAVCAAAALFFLTDPKSREPDHSSSDPAGQVRIWFDALHGDEVIWDGCREISLDEFGGVIFRCFGETLEAVTEKESSVLYSGMPIWSVFFCDLTGDGLPELCSALSLGSGLVDERVIIYDYANGVSYEISDRGNNDYTLSLQEGRLMVEKRRCMEPELLASGELVYRDDTLQLVPDILSENTVSGLSPLEEAAGFGSEDRNALTASNRLNDFYGRMKADAVGERQMERDACVMRAFLNTDGAYSELLAEIMDLQYRADPAAWNEALADFAEKEARMLSLAREAAGTDEASFS